MRLDAASDEVAGAAGVVDTRRLPFRDAGPKETLSAKEGVKGNCGFRISDCGFM